MNAKKNKEMINYPGEERRREIHVVCAKESDWGELKATLKSIAETQRRMEKNQEHILSKIFGNGHDGLDKVSDRNKQAIRRIWWWLGGVSLAVILGAITILMEHAKGKF